MTVFVDKLFYWPGAPKCLQPGCHLWSETSVYELSVMAKKLGLKWEWVHVSRGMPHFNISKNKRAQALQLGAQEGSLRPYLKRRLKQKEGHSGKEK